MTPDPARSLTDRIRHAASARGLEPARLRRQLVFQRILARLAIDDGWVLKGGFSLELRLGLHARATRDLDLAYVGPLPPATPLDVQDALGEILGRPGIDEFVFAVALPRAIAASELGNPGWRINVKATLGGVVFDDVRLDVVIRADEIGSAVEFLVVAPPLEGTPYGDVVIAAVDVPQHAAEKVHAYARIYAYDRPSSRVKDLIDLVLLFEAGLIDPEDWSPRISHVFSSRDGAQPPAALPEPPESWNDSYASMAAELGLSATFSRDGWLLVDEVYRKAIALLPEQNGPVV